MSRTRVVHHVLAVAAVGLLSASCGDVVRTGSAPVYLVVDSFLAAAGNKPATFVSPLNSDVVTNVISPAPCSADNPCPTVFNDVGQIQLRASLKDLGQPGTTPAPSANNEVTLSRYHVSYRRADGRNTPGVDVPYGFDGAATGTVPAGGKLTLIFELVKSIAKSEAPLVQLTFNGNVISTIADVTFYGTDQVGNVVTVTASITVNFANFGDQ